MYKSLSAIVAAGLLLGACETQQTQAVVAPPPPAPVAAPGFMVFFDWDRSNLSPQAQATLQQAAAAYKAGGSPRVNVIGHTDTSGPDGYNMALSDRRANAVKNELVRDGVPPDAVNASGVGKAGLLVPTADGVREPQNRRVELAVGQPNQASGLFNDPRAYCQALMDKWREFRTQRTDEAPSVAIAQCEAGNYQVGIPMLEDALIKGNFPLPVAGFRWPGQPYSRS